MQRFVVSWEQPGRLLNVAQGQTAGRQVDDDNGNNEDSLGRGRQGRHRGHSVLRHSISCPLERSRKQSRHKILKGTRVEEVEVKCVWICKWITVGICQGQTCPLTNVQICMFRVMAAWHACDTGARNVLPVTCGRGVKGFFWLRGFRMPAWPRFLFSPSPTLGIHGNVCVCVCVCMCVCVHESVQLHQPSLSHYREGIV